MVMLHGGSDKAFFVPKTALFFLKSLTKGLRICGVIDLAPYMIPPLPVSLPLLRHRFVFAGAFLFFPEISVA